MRRKTTVRQKYKIGVFDWKETTGTNQFLHESFSKKLKVWDAGTDSDTYALIAGKKKPSKKELEGYYGLEGENPKRFKQIKKFI